jgi:hypothetical protein
LMKVFVTGDVLSFLLQGAGELNNPLMRWKETRHIRSPRLI